MLEIANRHATPVASPEASRDSRQRRATPTRSLRFWLRLLAATCIVPALLVAASLIFASYVRQRDATISNSVATARALMQVVDRELVRAQTSMQTLATSPSLRRDDLTDFYQQAKQVLASTGGNSVMLAKLSGEQIVNTLVPLGTPLAPRNEASASDRAAATREPVISNSFIGSVSHRWMITVDVPVIRDGDVVYILDESLVAQNFEEIFRKQNASPSWTLTLLDRSGTVVARNRDSNQFVGARPPPLLLARLNENSPEGVFEDQIFDGVDELTAFSRSPTSGWTIAISIPNADLNADRRRTLLLSTAGAATLLLLGFAASQDISQRISRSIRMLREPANALASNEAVTMPPVAITEVREVGTALTAAADLLKQRETAQAAVAAAERQMAISERVIARFSALMEAVPYALVVVQPDGSISFANNKVTDLFGHDRSALLGRKVESLFAEVSRLDHFKRRAKFFGPAEERPAEARATIVGLRRDGTEFPAEIGVSPLELDGTPLAMAAFVDISERQLLAAAVAASHEEAMVSGRLSSLGSMAGGIANEINNPLTIINAAAEELAEDAARGVARAGQVVEAAQQITGMTDRIATIVRSLRHLARDGRHDPLVATALSDIVDKAIQVARQAFHGGDVSLTATPIDPGIRIACREVEISQIVLNLVQNAFEAAAEQALETRQGQWVRLDVTARDGRALLSVSDSGKGVTPEMASRIMEPFVTTKPVGKGTGLGLSLSRQIAEAHGGSLELSSANDHTCFILTLPQAT